MPRPWRPSTPKPCASSDDEKRSGFVGDRGDLGQTGDVPFHGIDPFHHDQLWSVVRDRLDDRAQVFRIVVGEALD